MFDLRLEKNEGCFPHPETVLKNGILAVGGKLSPQRLLVAYQFGIFPWYNEYDPVVWWCPQPRYVIFPDKVRVAKSMNSYFNQQKYRVTYNECFEDVLRQCRTIHRPLQNGTWINDDIAENYAALPSMGYAVSVEVWDDAGLAGGLYGIQIGRVFFGESMFSLRPNASKFGFITLARKLHEEGFYLIDCQLHNSHLESLGGEFIPGREFHSILRRNRMEWLAAADADTPDLSRTGR